MASSVQHADAMRMKTRLWMLPILALALIGASSAALTRDESHFALALQWPEEQRAFLQDGPGLLLTGAQLDELLDGDRISRQSFIDRFLDHDPIPETPANELRDGIARRQDLVAQEFLSLLDDRAKLLFLHGPPVERQLIDCIEVYKPLEIWRYPKSLTGADEHGLQQLLLYRPKPGTPYRLWLPVDGKRVLYTEEMEYFMLQWEENRNFIRGKRFDKQLCDEVEIVDLASGVDGLYGFLPGRPKNAELTSFLKPPPDLAAWAARAARTELPPAAKIPAGSLELAFPQRAGQRMETQFVVVLPPEAELGVLTNENERSEMRLTIAGELEKNGEIFDTFRMRFLLQPPAAAVPVALIAPRRLRPQEGFVARLRVVDELTGRELRFARGFVVPREPTPPENLPPVPPEAIVALGDELKKQRLAGYDSLILVPPESDVVFGLWRAEALVTGSRIRTVLFFLDDKQVFKRSRPPFTAELRLPPFPLEQVVRVEGYDEQGELVASDEVVLNQPRGQLKVRIVEPPRGNRASGPIEAKVEVVVPEERKVERVIFSVNEVEQAVIEKPPWQATVEAPPASGSATDLNYLTVVAQLDDGSQAEDVRFLNPPPGIDEVDVNLVELYTTVTDRNGRLVKGLEASNFKVWEDERPQTISKFELVEDLPLTLGITIDTSGSMFESLSEAKRAAVAFLDNIITPKDLCFALAFSDRPALLMPRTSDVGAVAERLADLLASGSTSLHDAVVTSLYYFRGIRGRRALVLLSDGEDTSSTISFPEALEYARISGVAIYAIGLRIGRAEIGVRRKLESLAEQTGGRTFYIKNADELSSVYDEIEEELRSQYLVAYNSDQIGEPGTYRQVRVEVRAGGRKLKARTIAGYYP
ncbi:MAG: VWA domain-containing protein [Acidobacteria bacterium]|nr:MAG: VWA domain-containing protein [Acidobacteriota bacterium]